MSLTIEQIQTLITNKHEVREIINEITDYLQVNPGGSSSYLVYTALLTQTGTSAPVATVLQNTIGNIVWTRASEGSYIGTLANAFSANKTWIQPSSNGNAYVAYSGTSWGGGFSIYRANANEIFIDSLDGTGNFVDWVNALANPATISIEIRVYP